MLLHPNPLHFLHMPKVPPIEKAPEKIREQPSDPQTLQELQTSAKAVHFMEMYASFMDRYGGDVLIGLVPALGDGAVSIGSLLVELQQANKVGLPWSEQLGILISQGLDFGIGSIPVVGDIADYFYKSNVKAKERFVSHFRRQLLRAWKEGKIQESDIPELEKLSGIEIRKPVQKRGKN